jgi:DNA-binding HxlR family transcriptional regulator
MSYLRRRGHVERTGSIAELVAGGGTRQAARMQGYGQFCPVALGAEVFAERWTPLILRELLLGSQRFSELRRGLPRISRNLLTQRLASLERAGLIKRQRRSNGHGYDYSLTPAGEELRPVVTALGTWGYKWAASELQPDNLDAGLLMWFLRRRVRVESLPEARVVTRFEFHAQGARSFWLEGQQSFWLILERPAVDLCLSDPGFEVDLTVNADVTELTRVYLGHISLIQAIREGSVEVVGGRELRSGFHDWIGVSPFANAQSSAS